MLHLLCVLCPKDGGKKQAEFIYIGNSYCWDCYYIRREEVKKQHEEYLKKLEELKIKE